MGNVSNKVTPYFSFFFLLYFSFLLFHFSSLIPLPPSLLLSPFGPPSPFLNYIPNIFRTVAATKNSGRKKLWSVPLPTESPKARSQVRIIWISTVHPSIRREEEEVILLLLSSPIPPPISLLPPHSRN